MRLVRIAFVSDFADIDIAFAFIFIVFADPVFKRGGGDKGLKNRSDRIRLQSLVDERRKCARKAFRRIVPVKFGRTCHGVNFARADVHDHCCPALDCAFFQGTFRKLLNSLVEREHNAGFRIEIVVVYRLVESRQGFSAGIGFKAYRKGTAVLI